VVYQTRAPEAKRTASYGPRAVRKLALAVVSLVAVLTGAARGPAAAPERTSVLVFTKTAGFRHASIPVAVQAVRELGARNGFTVDATEDAGAFADAALRRYAAVVFLLTTGDVLDTAQQEAFRRYVRSGGGFVGVHSAADTEHGWPWYGGLVGAYFRSHPAIQRATLIVTDRDHPSTAHLPARWTREDEWYNFAAPPRASVRVLALLDEASYAPGEGAMGARHPIAWWHAYDGGRSWYTAGGHTDASYAEPLFRGHLLGGIRYATGQARPRILSLATRARGGRVVVTVRFVQCRRCVARAVVRAAGVWRPTQLRVAGGTASALLPPGGAALYVTLEDRATALTTRSPTRRL
jgi:cytochrome c